MNTYASWQFEIDTHPANWEFPVGESWIAGWVWAGKERLAVDIRVWIDTQCFLGISGLPKPGIDDRLLKHPGPPHTGFIARVTPHQGARYLKLEVREPNGNWTELFHTDIHTLPEAPAISSHAPLSDQLGSLVPELLSKHRTAPHKSLQILADEIVTVARSIPLNALPVPPFHGALESPQTTGLLRYGRLNISGWLAHKTESITAVTAMIDARSEIPLQHQLPRQDIDEVFADLTDSSRSQFNGYIALPVESRPPCLLKIFATLRGQEKQLVFAHRFTPKSISGGSTSLPPLSRSLFIRTIFALYRAARKQGQSMGSATAVLRAAQTAWNYYQAEATPHAFRQRVPTRPLDEPVSKRSLRIVVATHNLNYEGAPWFIFELADYLVKQRNATIQIISPEDGPMRQIFEQSNMDVSVVNLKETLACQTEASFLKHLKEATAHLNWLQIDLVIANTMVSFWGIHLARIHRLPSLLYVHESVPIRRFFEPILCPELSTVVEQAFRDASHVIFTAASSQKVFEYLNTRGNFRLLPSWVDIDKIDTFTANHQRATLRKKHGLNVDSVILINIGSLCERKGQHIFLQAAALLQTELKIAYPDKDIEFVMVGARPGLYFESLKQEARLQHLSNVRFIPETGDIFDFYQLANVFVCTSFEESFPRVLLESAAFRLPIITTNVNGIPEMLSNDEAWLISPGDQYQLGAAVKKALTEIFTKNTRRAERARASVEARYHQAHSMPQHFALALQAIGQQASP